MEQSIPSKGDEKDDPGEAYVGSSVGVVINSKGSSAGLPDAQLCNVKDAQQEQGPISPAPGGLLTAHAAPPDGRMHGRKSSPSKKSALSLSGDGVAASANLGCLRDNSYNSALDDSDYDHWLSPTARKGSAEGSDFDWDNVSQGDELSPTLRGVHATAVEVMRRSLSMLESPEFFNERANTNDEKDDDDGMEEEEQSLSKKAENLQQSLTGVCVEDIDIKVAIPTPAAKTKYTGEKEAISDAPPVMPLKIGDEGGSHGGGDEVAMYPRRNGDPSLAEGSISGKSMGGNSIQSDGNGSIDDDRISSPGVRTPGDDSKLVFRAVARRPLKEMLRLDAAEETEGLLPVVRLEHLPPFTERWTPEALTPHILSQVFSGLVPIASRQGQREPVCTYMLECCVRPDVEAVTMLHIVSMVASDHGLEMVRKRGAQVLYGVAPPESGSQSSGGLRGGPGHVRRRTWSTASPASAISREPLTPPPRSAKNRANSPVNLAEVVGATPSPRTAVPLTNEPVFEDENSTAAGKSVAETAGGKKKGEKRRASLNKPDEEAVTVGTPELKGWRGTGGAGWGPWSHVDMQLVIGQASKHRVLLIRFVTARPTSCREALRLAATAAENGQPLAIAPAAQGFVTSVRLALSERRVLLESLEDVPPGDHLVDLDPQFLAQVEGMCQWDMVASLREAGVSLDEHARNEELRGVVVTRLLEEMFMICQLPMLPPPPQLVLAMPRPNDILPSSVETMPELSWEDEQELCEHLFASEASRIMAAVLARCIRYTERCDEQMTARMQRKNRQVMQRISRSQLYQRELFQALRDGQVAVQRTRMAAAFHRIVIRRPELGIDPAIESPIYYCSIISGRKPGYIYLTYWHLVLVTRMPGFSPQVFVIALEDVDAVERIKFFVGYGIQVKRRSPNSSSSRITPLTRSPASSSPAGPPAAGGGGGGSPAADGGTAAAGATAARRARPQVILFSTTSVSTGELRELIVALVRVHREPVTSPRTARSQQQANMVATGGSRGGRSATSAGSRGYLGV